MIPPKEDNSEVKAENPQDGEEKTEGYKTNKDDLALLVSSSHSPLRADGRVLGTD